MDQNSLKPSYLPELNTLRAFAVSIVIFAHWYKYVPIFSNTFSGDLGVVVFFTLSGFLITRILLIEKEKINSGSIGRKKLFTNFYIKRLLRIFPVYYLLLLYIYLFHHDFLQDSLKWHLGYFSNFYFVLVRKDWQEGLSHLWSLAVEEQFYLIWPAIIIFSPYKYLKFILIGFVLTGPIFRLTNLSHNEMYKYLTPSCFDSLGIGSLIALYEREAFKFGENKPFLLSILLLITFTFLPIIDLYIHNTYYKDVIERFNMSLFSSFLIIKTLTIKHSFIKNLIVLKPLMFIGTISYGLYLYHFLIPLHDFKNTPIVFDYLFRLFILFTIAISSYYIIEKKLLKLKQNFK